LLVIFVPSRDRSGQPVNQDYWVDENLATLGRLFRGSTAYPRGRGVWRNDAQGGVLIKEEPVIVFSYIAEEAITQESLSQVYQMMARMGRETNQGEIGIVLDGKYYGITDFSAE
jgi:hypothetical protein